MPLLGKFGTATSRAFGFNGGGTATVPIPVPPGKLLFLLVQRLVALLQVLIHYLSHLHLVL